MTTSKVIEELGEKIKEVFAVSPAKDAEKNIHALLRAMFLKLDLVTHEELDVQTKVLSRTREKLVELEARVAKLEAELRGR